MKGPRDPDAPLAAQQILEYLRTHADAADTAEGVARWWLSGRPPLPAGAVEQGLRWLVEQELVDRQMLPDGTVIYRGARATHTRH